jgi:hypothetical protein
MEGSMKRISMLILLVLAVTVSSRSLVGAHVLIRDSTRSVGAILHITPDDDPVAGKDTTIFFDIQQQENADAGYYFELLLYDPDGFTSDVPVTGSGSSATAVYAFPKQGLYNLRLQAMPKSSGTAPLVFTYAQRVSRGVTEESASAAGSRQYLKWADPVLIGSIAGFLALGILAFNRRADIVQYSKFK